MRLQHERVQFIETLRPDGKTVANFPKDHKRDGKDSLWFQLYRCEGRAVRKRDCCMDGSKFHVNNNSNADFTKKETL